MGDGWAGAILTGGRSTRMGRDKALLPVDGEPMAVRVERALRAAGATTVVCIGGDAPRLRAAGLDVVDDDHPGEGPLGGLLTALRWSPAAVTVITPCDLLRPTPDAFRALVHALEADASAVAAVPIVDGHWRALPVVVRTAVAGRLEDLFDTGERAVHRAVEQLPFVEVDAGPLHDADEPGELDDHR